MSCPMSCGVSTAVCRPSLNGWDAVMCLVPTVLSWQILERGNLAQPFRVHVTFCPDSLSVQLPYTVGAQLTLSAQIPDLGNLCE
eukprot:3612806-Pyramimonas_sp.AAC.1